MEKLTRALAIFSVCIFCILMPCFILTLSGTVNLSIESFAVDATDRLYVGTTKEICVYQDDRLINTINPQTSKGYAFTIHENKTIILATPSKNYTMDLEGNIIQSQDDREADMYNQLKAKRRSFTTVDGDIYRLEGTLGRSRIVKNDQDIVYQISLLSVAVKYMYIGCGISIFVFVFLLARRQRGQRGQGDGSPVS